VIFICENNEFAMGTPLERTLSVEDITTKAAGYGIPHDRLVVDDVLDVAGDAETTGKTLLADLAEGKMTYPMLRALERRPDLGPMLEVACAGDDVAPELGARIVSVLRACGVVEECLELARRLCNEAIAALEVVPDGVAKTALIAVARATPERRK